MTTPVIAVVGYSDSGKTTVAAALIQILSNEGYKVAAVKHCPHGHDIDREGSDTHRMTQAGAAAVLAASPRKVTRSDRVEAELSLESLVDTLDSFDLVIAEGFKDSDVPKVLVAKKADLRSRCPIRLPPSQIWMVESLRPRLALGSAKCTSSLLLFAKGSCETAPLTRYSVGGESRAEGIGHVPSSGVRVRHPVDIV